MSVLHGSFTVTREIDAPLPRVRDAYSVEKPRSSWRRIPGPDSVLTLDFRVGGPFGDATRITHTEQYTFLAWAGDGAHDQAHLRGSTQLAFNALAALVEPARAFRRPRRP
jgi:hypothetical protein